MEEGQDDVLALSYVRKVRSKLRQAKGNIENCHRLLQHNQAYLQAMEQLHRQQASTSTCLREAGSTNDCVLAHFPREAKLLQCWEAKELNRLATAFFITMSDLMNYREIMATDVEEICALYREIPSHRVEDLAFLGKRIATAEDTARALRSSIVTIHTYIHDDMDKTLSSSKVDLLLSIWPQEEEEEKKSGRL